jgi:hypothetical protein
MPAGSARCVLASAAMRALLFLLVPLVLPGCISVSVDGVDGFQGQSAAWLVKITGNTRTHELVLSSVGDYCTKRQNAEADALEARQVRDDALDAGDPVCEAQDVYMDALAWAFAALDGDGKKALFIRLDREDETDQDVATAPGPGTFSPVGAGNDGSFEGSLEYRNGRLEKERADAFECVDPDNQDLDLSQLFATEEEPDLIDTWQLNGGTVEISEGGSDAWTIDVDADLASGGTTIGSIASRFDAGRCEVVFAE